MPFAEEAPGLPAESERLERKSTDNQKLKPHFLVKNLHFHMPYINFIWIFCKKNIDNNSFFLDNGNRTFYHSTTF
ncbi:hypothetical protein D0463_08740 [Bacillus sp. V59.32b]|nr:hypothetical protein D0463_08740 [Bacillus sp. V59.32b]